MQGTSKLSERLAIGDVIDPVSQAAGTVSSGWVSMATAERLLAVIQTGTLGTSATVDAKLQQATDASGTGAKDIAGKAITQIVKASGDAKQAEINLRAEELDTNGGFAYVRLSLTVGAAASLVSAVILLGDTKNGPASVINHADVVQIVG